MARWLAEENGAAIMPLVVELSMLAALSSIAVAHAPQSLSPSDVVEAVQWVRKPVPEAVGQFMPDFASLIGVSGRVTLQCQALFEGTPQNCQVVSVQPDGFGFEDAAKFVAATGVIRPWIVNGEPQAGVFRFSVQFTAEPIPSVPTDTYDGQEPTLATIERAREVIDMYPLITVEDRWRETVENLEADRQSTVHGWLEELFPLDVEEELRRHALALARVTTEDDLNAFLLTGTPLREPSADVFEAALGVEDLNYLTTLRTLRARYCARWSCEIVQD